MQYTNEVLRHAGLPNARNFTAQEVASVVGYTGANSLSVSAPSRAERAVQAQLQRFYEKPQRDLHALLRRFGLDLHLRGVDAFLNLS